MRPPLWVEITLSESAATTASGSKEAVAEVRLSKCKNCGQVKILSNPCGFDHLAALMEFRGAAE